MKKVLIPTRLDGVAADILAEQGGYEILQQPGADLLELAAEHPDTYALIVRSEKVTAEVLDAFPKLKVVVRAGAGYNTIDTHHARRCGVDVMNTPGANSNAVAEEVVALMLADARHLIPADGSCRAGRWEKSKFMGREITGKTLGILGLGHIGQLLAQRVKGFDMRVLAFDPVVNAKVAEDLGVALVEAEQIFEQADYISLHIPENEKTRGMINAELVGRMRPGATLINCARAGVLDEDALRALKDERKLRFLNDVYPADAEGEKSVADIADIMVPHLGASTLEANQEAARKAARQLIALDSMGATGPIVNRDIPEGLDEAYSRLAYTLTRLGRLIIGESTPLQRIETSIYGELKRYADWLVVPVVCAINPDFDRSLDHNQALRYLDTAGVAYASRDVDDIKGFKNSITVDLFTSSGSKVSVRGTVTEGRIVVSRINDFEGLYFEPAGHIALFVYPDKPGVLARIAGGIAAFGANIDDVRNPHDREGRTSIAILAVNRCVAAATEAIAADIDASTAFCAEFG